MKQDEKKRLADYKAMGTMNREQVEDYFILRQLEEAEVSTPVKVIVSVKPVEVKKPVSKKKKK